MAEGGHYGVYDGTDPEMSYLFNLADSGIDIPDGEVPDDGDHLTVTFKLDSGLENEPNLFFRIEEE